MRPGPARPQEGEMEAHRRAGGKKAETRSRPCHPGSGGGLGRATRRSREIALDKVSTSPNI